MNKKAIIAGAAAAALLTTGLLVPSFAFLSGQSRKVVNRFVSGLITVDLKETLVDPETGKKIDDEPRVYENTYLTVAGRVVDKDPTPIKLLCLCRSKKRIYRSFYHRRCRRRLDPCC